MATSSLIWMALMIIPKCISPQKDLEHTNLDFSYLKLGRSNFVCVPIWPHLANLDLSCLRPLVERLFHLIISLISQSIHLIDQNFDCNNFNKPEVKPKLKFKDDWVIIILDVSIFKKPKRRDEEMIYEWKAWNRGHV